MRIAEFIEKTNAAATAEQVFALFQRAVGDLGYDRIAFAAVTRSADQLTQPAAPAPAIAVHCPEDWVKYYLANRYHEIDPVVLLTPRRRTPLLWADIVAREALSAKQKQIFAESREAGLYNGVSIPVHGPFGESCIVSLATDNIVHDNHDHLPNLQIFATQFHLAYSQISGEFSEPASAIHLTERERECLTWTARGKTAWEISRIIDVTEHTVNFHLKGVMKKMGSVNRLAAVVVALRAGLIAP